MKISKFTPSICCDIDADIQAALATVEKKWNINIKAGGGTYTDDTFTTNLKASLSGVDTAKKDWERYAVRFGLSPDQYGTTFKHQGETFTVVGIAPKAKKFPVIGANAAGTPYKFPASVLGAVEFKFD